MIDERIIESLPGRSRIMWRSIGLGVLALFFLLQISAVFFHAGDGVMRPFSWLVLPPAWVRWSPVSYHRVVETAHAFVVLGIAPSYQEAFPDALGFVLRDVRLEHLLQEKDLAFSVDAQAEGVITDTDVQVLVAGGVSLSEQERFLADPLLRLRGADALRNEALLSQETRLQNVLEKVDLGMPFADIARYFSEDSSAMNGGDLGVFLVSELPVWAQDAANMEVGDVRSDVVGSDAFWVVKLADAGGEGEEAWVHLRAIAINKPTLAAILRADASEHPALLLVW
jgi:PPIC-type PPIASE domain